VSEAGVPFSSFNVSGVTPNVAGKAGLFCVHLSITTANVATVSITDASGTGSSIGTPGWVATAEIVGIYDSSDGCGDGIAVQTLVTTPGTISSDGSVEGLEDSFYLIVN
jgi:hypothetical protein